MSEKVISKVFIQVWGKSINKWESYDSLSLLANTVIVPTDIIIMHVYKSTLFVDNDIMLDDSNNLHAVKALVLIS